MACYFKMKRLTATLEFLESPHLRVTFTTYYP